MQKASTKAVALNQDISWEEASRALKSSQVHQIFASPEYLQNPYMKKFYIQEESHTHIFGVARLLMHPRDTLGQYILILSEGVMRGGEEKEEHQKITRGSG